MANFAIEESQEKRLVQINLRLTEHEAKDLEECAKAVGLEKSEFIRACLFFGKPQIITFKKNFSFILSMLSKMNQGF